MYDYDLYAYSVKRKKPKRKIFFSFFGVVIVMISLFWFILNNKNDNPKQMDQNVLSATEKRANENSKLGTVINQTLSDARGSYSVVIKNLKTNEAYYFNPHVVYESGSLYKLWIMAEVFEQLKAGKFKDSDVLEGDVAKLNEEFQIASDSADLTEGTVSFTVSSALQQMITISHNYAALLLTEKVGLASIKTFLDNSNFQESKVGIDNSTPTITAADTALFLEKLYKGELADPDSTQKMLDLLKAQQLNNKLPKYLPESVVIAHKTGELDSYSHDAGIVYAPNGDYIIVVLTKSDYPPDAEEKIAEVSQVVYDYFSHQ